SCQTRFFEKFVSDTIFCCAALRSWMMMRRRFAATRAIHTPPPEGGPILMTRATRVFCCLIAAWAAPAVHAQISLNGARIGAEDVAGLAEFYQEAFGLEEVNRLEFPGMLEIMLDFGETAEAARANPAADVVIMTPESDNVDDPVPPLVFNVSDAAAVAAAVEAAGAPLDGPPRAFGKTGILV